MPTIKDSFCVFRWDQSVINFGTAGITTCCRTMPKPVSGAEIRKHGKNVFLNSDYLIERRKEMLEGVRHSDCRECWDIEEQGHPSFRRTSHDPKESIEDFLKRAAGAKPEVSQHVESLILFIGNTCDLKCIYCGYSLSSSWAAEDLKFGKISKELYDELTTIPEELDSVFWDYFEEHKLHLRHISFVGGEPLTMKRTYDFLERLNLAYQDVELKEPVTICVTSNLNASEKTFANFVSALERFKNSSIRIKIDGSIDTIGERANYIRSGISWDRWRANFIKLLELKSVNTILTVIPSVSALSATSCHELFTELGKLQEEYGRQIRIQENAIMTPQFLSPYSLPPEFSTHFMKAAEAARKGNLKTESGNDYAIFLENIAHAVKQGHAYSHPKYRRELHNYLEELNQRRGTDHRKTFPEMLPYFQICENEDRFFRRGVVGRTDWEQSFVINKDSSARAVSTDLRIPLDGSVLPDELFRNWLKLNRNEFHLVSFTNGDPSSSPHFAPFFQLLSEVLCSVNNRVTFHLRTELSGTLDKFSTMVEALKGHSSHVRMQVHLPVAGHRHFFVGNEYHHWHEICRRLEILLSETEVTTAEILFPVYFFTLPDLRFILQEFINIKGKTGKGMTLLTHQSVVQPYYSPEILTSDALPWVESSEKFLKEHFPDGREMLHLLSDWRGKISLADDSEKEWMRSRFKEELQKLEENHRKPMVEFFPEFGKLLLHLQSGRETEINYGEADLAEALKKLSPYHAKILTIPLQERVQMERDELLPKWTRTREHINFLRQSLNYLESIRFLPEGSHEKMGDKLDGLIGESPVENHPALVEIFLMMSRMDKERRQTFLNLFPELRRPYKFLCVQALGQL